MSDPMRPMRLETMTWPEVGDEISAGTPIVLPVGAVEQHGPHLPLGTDAFIPHHLALRVAATRRLVVAPPIVYGAYSRPRTGGGRHFPGSVGLPGRTLERVVAGVVQDWMRQGFRRVMVLNGHFENAWTLLEAVERAIEPYGETHKAVLVHWWDQVGDDDVRSIFGEGFPGWEAEHASITETSMMEVFEPGLVRTDLKAEGGAKRLVTYDIFPAPEDILWPNGVGFSAVPASAAFGRRLVDLLVERIGTIVDSELSGG